MNHIDQLQLHISDLKNKKILDLGSGRGGFLIEAGKRGFNIQGLEMNPDYIDITNNQAKESGTEVKVTQGVGEKLPFRDGEFDFINISEVIEHVEDPKLVLKEVMRVLSPGGFAYLSVPNRFGFFDPHYKILMINWLPRRFAERIIDFFNKSKVKSDSGRQKLSEMHYYSYRQIALLLKEEKFTFFDIRNRKIKRIFGSLHLLIYVVYLFFREYYFNTFHFILEKK